MTEVANTTLKKTLGPLMLWGLGVGYVISGMYFGWNLGLQQGGTLGLGIATIFIIIMYLTFTFGYTELACAIPKAGGAFDYANKALGPQVGFLAGLFQIIEFVFAPPAIAAAIGAYFHLIHPGLPTMTVAIGVYILFTSLNIIGVKTAASIELIFTVLAVIELLIFAGVALPHFEWKNMTLNALPNGFEGVFAAIPFAIWFFLAIEGVANVAEETINPQRNVLIGFGASMLTLVVLCLLTFFSAIGVAGWEAIVFDPNTSLPSDSPLPLALSHIVHEGHFLFRLLVSVGLIGLVASFHGIILAAGRATFEMGRIGHFPKVLGKIHQRFQTPAVALIVNMFVGIIALMTNKTGEIITLACFGALGLYIISMISLMKLRQSRPDLPRPFKVPFYPYSPIIALTIASFSLVAMTVYNFKISIVFYTLIGLGMLWFKLMVFEKTKGAASETV